MSTARPFYPNGAAGGRRFGGERELEIENWRLEIANCGTSICNLQFPISNLQFPQSSFPGSPGTSAASLTGLGSRARLVSRAARSLPIFAPAPTWCGTLSSSSNGTAAYRSFLICGLDHHCCLLVGALFR